MQSVKEALRSIHIAHSTGASLLLFATRTELCASDPLKIIGKLDGRR